MIGIIIVSWGRSELLEGTLSSLFLNTTGQANVCIVDNGSEKETIDVIEKWRDHFGHVCLFAENEGKPRALNYGVEFFKKFPDIEYYLFCDSDLYFKPNWNIEMLEHHKAFESYKDKHGMTLGSLSGFKFSNQGQHHVSNGKKIIIYPYPAGCCMLVKKETHEKIGKFKEDRLIRMVDVDYYRRMKIHHNLYAGSMFPNSVIDHTGVNIRTFNAETGKSVYHR